MHLKCLGTEDRYSELRDNLIPPDRATKVIRKTIRIHHFDQIRTSWREISFLPGLKSNQFIVPLHSRQQDLKLLENRQVGEQFRAHLSRTGKSFVPICVVPKRAGNTRTDYASEKHRWELLYNNDSDKKEQFNDTQLGCKEGVS